ncbi:hypothetical protein QVD17_00112 [Tagetes erecta]|uniref:Uncharacterized protein n=1 Tax=Tagetes erecta TaxID=13708 RepID=A0AAD8P5J7_TARER|nr:hypothetical protein QVD17_00112 [Tagetes erecta]
MAGKERKSTLEGLACKIRNIDGCVSQAILKKAAVVTKVGSINMPVKQTLEPTVGIEGATETVQKVETNSYLEKVKNDMPLHNKGGKPINFRLIENLVKRDGVDAVLPKESGNDGESGIKGGEDGSVKVGMDWDDEVEENVYDETAMNHRSRIDIIRDTNGVLHEGGNVLIVFVKHYEAFLGVEGVTSAVLSPDLGDCNSVRCIMKSFHLFTDLSGLMPSLQKSTAFFCHVPHHVKVAILDVLPFEEGTLPVRYLGVPLISSRLTYKDWASRFGTIAFRVGVVGVSRRWPA